MVGQAWNLSIWEPEAVDVCEFEASLFYIINSRPARAP